MVDSRLKSSSSSSYSYDVKSPVSKSGSFEIEFNEQLRIFLQYAAGILGRDKKRKNHASDTASSENETGDTVSNSGCDGALKSSSNRLPDSIHEKTGVYFGPHLSWVEVLCC